MSHYRYFFEQCPPPSPLSVIRISIHLRASPCRGALLQETAVFCSSTTYLDRIDLLKPQHVAKVAQAPIHSPTTMTIDNLTIIQNSSNLTLTLPSSYSILIPTLYSTLSLPSLCFYTYSLSTPTFFTPPSRSPLSPPSLFCPGEASWLFGATRGPSHQLHRLSGPHQRRSIHHGHAVLGG